RGTPPRRRRGAARAPAGLLARRAGIRRGIPAAGSPPAAGHVPEGARFAVATASSATTWARPPGRALGSPYLVEREDKFAKEGLTFDDVLLVPAESAVLPNDVSTASRLTRTIALEIPLLSAAMD